MRCIGAASAVIQRPRQSVVPSRTPSIHRQWPVACGSFRLERLHLSSKALLLPSHHRTLGLQIKVKLTRFYRTTRHLRTSSPRLLLRLSSISLGSPRRSLNLVWCCDLGNLSYCSFCYGSPSPSLHARLLNFTTTKHPLNTERTVGIDLSHRACPLARTFRIKRPKRLLTLGFSADDSF